ncbi:MAG TPA: alanine racemase C-terminal domain-containing protein, partial [Flavobacteriales bacterium]|nr:alanine racemase C-terminal domain-containing protein [Flavobacteriales bacterium]
LRTIISQIKKVGAHQTVGYGRKGKVEKDAVIATLPIGYADGFSRALSNGRGEVIVHGKRAKVIGNVCMDMTMIDISTIPEAREGDEVIIFGAELPVAEIAEKLGTIPYEILTSVSARVKRVYLRE